MSSFRDATTTVWRAVKYVCQPPTAPPVVSTRNRFILTVLSGTDTSGDRYMSLDPLAPPVSAGYAPAEVPLYPDRATVETEYETAEREGTAFFAIERYEEGFAITYDLLPAGSELSEPALAELDERITREVEGIVGDDSRPTTEVSRSIGDSLGQLSFFAREETAREIAAVVSTIVLDDANWVTATPPDSAGSAYRTN